MAELPPDSRLAGSAPVLVVVITNRADWLRVLLEGWYRIPLKHAPQPVAADALAFYLTRPFGAERWQVAWYAPTLRYQLVTRRDLLPHEPHHPRAADPYYRIALGPAQRLPRPIPSRRLRRVTFIPTTWEQLLTAADVADLWQSDDTTATLWAYFPDAAIKASARLNLDEEPGC